jgi:hypothetical protein
MQVQKNILALMLSFHAYAFELKDFFIFDDWQQPVVFWVENQNETQINGLKLMFLESSDCQSGYIDSISIQANPLKLKSQQVFSLDSHKIYQVMQQMHFFSAKSVLIRFTKPPKGFAQFVGGCEDQGINCCLPIEVDDALKNCKISPLVQPIYFDDIR